MTIPRRSWRAAGTYAAVAVAGLTGAVLCAGPAAAHTPTWAVTCTDVSLDLTAYNGGVTNQVTVTVDGKDLLPTETFGSEFHKKLELPQHDKELTVHLVVKAGDGDQFSKDETKTAPVCEDNTPTPKPSVSESKPAEKPTTAAPSPSESSPETAPAAASPSPSSPDLAETGSSSATPIIGGAAVAVLLAGGGIMWSVRKRRTAQH
ncbi:LPXTG cell wall anchor domain-containing protein [Streptomyces sp. NBC_01724]|uniref:LAETG motif-containing sortase-dependent surface protein n=1 Tax=unclassified Streptomyces TaxID=2593676 RepID=UPI002E34A0AC|nr:LAETG motif-containing sortase-dependent surface protein [Streptomyces sp. NBC_01724]WTE56023.1 LPXTG cell wall anchor domain-containing protein [Streptomyces sp. NBC_01620]WTE64098.1 LPXTG cell wall anchor domain-containing protein [Streptomyces sp. NBC_01617]WTI91381.1 LPXTG cell wall anchor domain-containing protein [Streptomyces sp. NBC_00724]